MPQAKPLKHHVPTAPIRSRSCGLPRLRRGDGRAGGSPPSRPAGRAAPAPPAGGTPGFSAGITRHARTHEYLGEVLVRAASSRPDRLAAASSTPPGARPVAHRPPGRGERHRRGAHRPGARRRVRRRLHAEGRPHAVPLALVSRLPITYAKQHKILPLAEDDDTRLTASWPIRSTPRRIDDVRGIFGKPVEFSVASGEAVLNAINRVWEKKEHGGTRLEGDHANEEEQPRRHHRLGRRRADHRLGQRPLRPGGPRAGHGHPHRARRA